MKKIKIFDTTLRDGEQSPGATMSFEEKLKVAKQLEKMNVDIIEAGFPASNKEDFKAIETISRTIKNSQICALARCKKEDIKTAWESIKDAKKPRIHVFIATSDIHLKHKLKKTKSEIIKTVKENVEYSKSLCDNIEFSAEDATRTKIDFLDKVFATAISAGATTINIPDSVGFSQPKEFGAMIKYFSNKPNFENICISVHCHNDLGMAVANSMAGIENGATQIECTVNGIGERAGNAAVEEIVMLINTRRDVYPFTTNINLKEIINSSKIVSNATNIFVQKNKAIVGANAFAHEAGIHQHGVLSNPKCYEIINANTLGTTSKCVIGRHSGKHAVSNFMQNNGIKINDQTVNQAMRVIKELNKTENAEQIIISTFRGQ